MDTPRTFCKIFEMYRIFYIILSLNLHGLAYIGTVLFVSGILVLCGHNPSYLSVPVYEEISSDRVSFFGILFMNATVAILGWVFVVLERGGYLKIADIKNKQIN